MNAKLTITEVKLTKEYYTRADISSSDVINIEVKYEPFSDEVREILGAWVNNRRVGSETTVLDGIFNNIYHPELKKSLLDFWVECIDWREVYNETYGD